MHRGAVNAGSGTVADTLDLRAGAAFAAGYTGQTIRLQCQGLS